VAEKLDDLPDEGKVVIAHPTAESWKVEAIAEREGCDWVETDYCPPRQVFVMDVGNIKRSVVRWGSNGR
jgi:hypothetical protein